MKPKAAQFEIDLARGKLTHPQRLRMDIGMTYQARPQMFRPLGGHERMMYHYSSAHPRHFCIVAELTAARLPDDYRRAHQAVLSRHPLLRAKIDFDHEGGPSFYECPMIPEPDLLQRQADFDWCRTVESELQRDFDAAAPRHRTTIVHDDTGAHVIITLHHAIADAIAGTAIIEDLMHALAGRPLAPLGFPTALEGDEIFLTFDRPRTGVEVALKGMPNVGMLIEIASQPLWRDFQGDRIAVRSASLDENLVAGLESKARKHRIPLNSIICTSIAAAALKREARKNYRILSAINLRPILGFAAGECAMRTIEAVVPLASVSAEHFWICARWHSEQIASIRDPEKISSNNRLLDSVISPGSDPRLSCGLLGTLNQDATVTNLGRLSVARSVDDVGLTALWGPMGHGRLSTERFFGISILGDKLHLVETTPADHPSFIDGIIEVLEWVSQS
ncbi:hypothetical protein HGP17_28290 [Rhizobium sp. P38BS-XIX]|uniref:hypothetical protein n=1 Tax=Rhizobium sp. P38BS-XIX TaxID=2726740 RepID=UPI001456A81E|nr:hypothetical protein [Rhizobium sp. P38BS-XIX]NLS00748.1 hypothetical protein [Rhizobium sp. P38BS-XIX]